MHPIVLKVWSQAAQNSIAWKLMRNANSWFPAQTCWIRNPGGGAQQSSCQQVLQVILMHTWVWEPWLYATCSTFVYVWNNCNEKFKKIKKPPRMALGLILWIWSYSKENQELKFETEDVGMEFLYLNFTESPSKGVCQIKMSRASLNLPTVLRPLLIF